MCLAIPMQISQLDGDTAICVAQGVTREVSLMLVQDENLQLGDYLLIHVGYAIQKISTEDALSTWELLDVLLAEDAARA